MSDQYETAKIQVQENHSANFLIIWMSNKKTVVKSIGAAKSKRKFIKECNMLWKIVSKFRGHTKINQQVKEALQKWILHHPRVVKYQIVNDCLYVSIDGI